MELFVGNLPPQMGRMELKEIFEGHGDVSAVRLIVDKFSGISRGFAFVNMPNDDEAITAIKTLDGQEFQGSKLRVEPSWTPPRHKVD